MSKNNAVQLLRVQEPNPDCRRLRKVIGLPPLPRAARPAHHSNRRSLSQGFTPRRWKATALWVPVTIAMDDRWAAASRHTTRPPRAWRLWARAAASIRAGAYLFQ
jgi:hypothetical protein